MIRVFRAEMDSDSYQYLLLADRDLIGTEAFQFDGTRIESWTPPSVFSYQPKLRNGDFWGFEMTSAALVIRHPAAALLAPFLHRTGQLLPLKVEGGDNNAEFQLLNVTECVNCLDHDRTEWIYSRSTGKPIRIAKYAFHPDRFPESSIFKIPETARGGILCYEGLRDPEDEFKTFVEAHHLSGIRFQELWRSE